MATSSFFTGLKYYLKSKQGKSHVISYPDDLDTSKLDNAAYAAMDVFNKYMERKTGEVNYFDVTFKPDTTIDGKEFSLEISVSYNDKDSNCLDVWFSLILPFSEKEGKKFLKKFRDENNLIDIPLYSRVSEFRISGDSRYIYMILRSLGLNASQIDWEYVKTDASVSDEF